MKPQVYYFKDHVVVLSDQEPKKSHKHLASHLVISLDADMEWSIGEEKVVCRAIYIDANVEHAGRGKGRFLTFLFVKTSDYAYSIEQQILKGSTYSILDEQIQNLSINTDPMILDQEILQLLRITKEKRIYDSRIQEAIQAIELLETIDKNCMETLSQQICLSQSRFSHLFKEETGMSLASYLAFEKLRKTYKYLLEGNNITDSCMKAGFDSPSHCASSCTKMFGISLKQIAFI